MFDNDFCFISDDETLAGGGMDTAGLVHTMFEIVHVSDAGGSSTLTLSDNTKITFIGLNAKLTPP